MARLIANAARRGKARDAPVLPPVKRVGSMSQPGEMTSQVFAAHLGGRIGASELETSQVFAAHLGGGVLGQRQRPLRFTSADEGALRACVRAR
jgi:hypothetical protein